MFKKKKIRRSREFSKNNKVIDFEKAKKDRKEKRDEFIKSTQAKQNDKEEPSKRKLIRRNRKRLIYIAIIITIIVTACVSLYRVAYVNIQRDEAIASKQSLEAERARLEQLLLDVDTPEFIEQQARTTLRMIRPGETFFIVQIADDEN